VRAIDRVFGSLQPNNLRGCSRARYQSSFCGSCHAMAELGRPWALATGYDIAFLHLLMVTLEGSPLERLPCTAVPFRKLPIRRLSEPARAWLVAVNILLMEEKCRDDVADEKAWRAQLGLKLIGKQADRARRVIGESNLALLRQLTTLSERQRELEREQRTLEEYALPTSLLLGDVFAQAAVVTGRPEMSRAMRQLGQGLGAAIYVKDALDDLEQDRKVGRFNAVESSSPPSSRQYVRTSLRREVRRSQTGLERMGMSGGEACQILKEFDLPTLSRPLRRRSVAGFCEILMCCDFTICCDAAVCCDGASVCAACPCDACCVGAATSSQEKTSPVKTPPVESNQVLPLHCPGCGDDLHPQGVGKVEIDECRSCHGLWLDSGELEVLANAKVLPDRLLVKRKTPPLRQLRPEGTRPCPRCSQILVGTVVKGVRLDLCADCQGVWLDQGELNQILEA
jgi:uncharacterized protein